MENEVKTTQENEVKTAEMVEVNVDFKDRYLRALADYQNLKRVTDERNKKLRTLVTMAFVTKLLPIVDDIEAGANTGDQAMLAIYRKLIVLLAEVEIYQFGRGDKMFDSQVHNAIATNFDQTKEDNEIISVKRYGYKAKDGTILRVADVIVNKKPEEKTEETKTEE